MPRKAGKENLPPKPYFHREMDLDIRKRELELEIKKMKIEYRSYMMVFLVGIFAFLVVFTGSIIILHGFSIGGLNLDTTTVNILATATIAEVAGLLTIALKWLFDTTKD